MMRGCFIYSGKNLQLTDGIELSAHALCAEDHLPWQGLQMSIKDFERLQNRLDRPFGLWNCRHSWHYIILGVSEPAYSPEELEAYKRHSREEITIDGVTKTRYQWTQEQRRIETAIRQQKDIAVMARASGDMVARRECAAMIRELDNYYGKISAAAGIPERRDKMRVAGFNAVKPVDELKERTEYGTMKAYSTMLSGRKFVSKSDANRKLPITGDPDSITDFLNEAGDTVLQRRIYDFEGKAAVDFDTNNHEMPKHHPTGAHKHIFDYSKKNPHGPAIPLSEIELKQNKDIVQKGVNYFDPE